MNAAEHLREERHKTYDEVNDSDAADDHPVSWCSNFDGGRVWYTALGHTQSTYTEPDFLKHLLGGLKTVAGAVVADCGPMRTSPPTDNDFELTTPAKGVDKTGEPIAMAVLPDRRVLHTSRDGRVWLTTPNATTSLAGTVPTYSHDEEGLQGIAIDADFATNQWVYVYYSPKLSTPSSDAPFDGTAADSAPYKGYTQLSRMKLTDAGTIDLASEQKILQVPADRGSCCHVGGEIDFDGQGNLFLSTGDDSNPFYSDGYAPLDERATRNPVLDAQRTAGNTNDLRQAAAHQGRRRRLVHEPGRRVGGAGVGAVVAEVDPAARSSSTSSRPPATMAGHRRGGRRWRADGLLGPGRLGSSSTTST